MTILIAMLGSSARIVESAPHGAAIGVLRTIQVAGADSIALDQRTGLVFVVGNGVITTLNARSGGPLATATVGMGPYAIAVDDRDNHIFVASSFDSRAVSGPGSSAATRASVTMLDASSGAVQNTVPITGINVAPSALAVASRAGRVFVATAGGSASIVMLDARTGAALRTLDSSVVGLAAGLAADERTGHIFASSGIMLDAHTGDLLKHIPSGNGNNSAEAIAIDEQAGHAFIAGSDPQTAGGVAVYILSTATGSVLKTLTRIGNNDLRILGLDRQSGRLFLGNVGSVLTLDSSTGRLVGRSYEFASAIAFDVRLHRAYVTTTAGASEPPSGVGVVRVLDDRSGALLANAPVGMGPTSVAVDAVTNLVFVANAQDRSVSVIDTRLGLSSPVRTTTVGRAPQAVALDPHANRALVVDTGSNSVSILDARTGILVRTTRVGAHPVAIAVDEATNRAFVANYRAASVTMLNTQTGAALRTVAVGRNPAALGVDTGVGHIFVVNANGYSVTILDARTGHSLRTVAVGATPIAIGVDGRTHRAFVVNRDSSTVSVLDTRRGTLVRTVPVATTPGNIAVALGTGRIFVTAQVGNSITMLDASNGTPITTVAPGIASLGTVAVDEGTSRVFVFSQISSTYSVLDAAKGTTIAVSGSSAFATDYSIGQGQHAVAVATRGSRVLVTNADDDTVSVLDGTTGATIGAISVGERPAALAVDEAIGKAFVVNNGDRSISILNTTTLHF